MTFPVVAARTATSEGVAATAHPIGLGSPTAGDLLVAFLNTATSSILVDEAISGTEWVQVFSATATSLGRVVLLFKLATGSDALTVHTTASVRMAAVCYRITGYGGLAGGATTSAFNTANANPPAASITGSAQDVLFITAVASDGSVASAAPTNYGSLTTASGLNAFISVAERTLNATTDDPGPFTQAANSYIATTIAIPEFAPTTPMRVTQSAVEAVSITSPAARVTQISAEVVSIATPAMRVTQLAVEMISQNVPDGLAAAGPGMLLIAT